MQLDKLRRAILATHFRILKFPIIFKEVFEIEQKMTKLPIINQIYHVFQFLHKIYSF